MRTIFPGLPKRNTTRIDQKQLRLLVRAMGGVGDVLAPKLIAEIGDIRRFHSGKALIAFAGIDAPPYESG